MLLEFLFSAFLISVVSTSFMTGFSYLLSRKKNRQFREPEILNELINTASTLNISVQKNNILGWIIHYGIGLLFTICFLYLYKIDVLAINLISIILFGIIAGCLGIIGWHLMFKLNHNPPNINLKTFYLQLLLAHLVFSLFLVGTFYLLKL